LARRGHVATVVTTLYEPALPLDEVRDGVRIHRLPVAARISKGVLAPGLGRKATQLMREHDVVSIHLPQFDAPGLSLRAHRENRPAILTYHCDLQLPRGAFNRVVDRVVFTANYTAGRMADKIVTYTRDYADHSPLLSKFGCKLAVIPPPVVMRAPTEDELAAFKTRYAPDGGPLIGFVARLAAEKGVEYMVEAMPRLVRRHPNARVLFAGQYLDVLGEDAYRERLKGPIASLGPHWEFLGVLTPDELAAFYGACDVQVVPSLNSTESFGLVQVEAMLCGTPVVASNLPGVRQPVTMTGMGEVVQPGSAAALAEGIERVLCKRPTYVRSRAEIEARFDVERTVDAYLGLFEAEIARRRST
jgi:glycosyltransferase involved in cell wall biosynthesis